MIYFQAHACSKQISTEPFVYAYNSIPQLDGISTKSFKKTADVPACDEKNENRNGGTYYSREKKTKLSDKSKYYKRHIQRNDLATSSHERCTCVKRHITTTLQHVRAVN